MSNIWHIYGTPPGYPGPGSGREAQNMPGTCLPGHDGIPAQTQSTGLKNKPKDWNTMNSVYQPLNLQKSGRWIEVKASTAFFKAISSCHQL